MPTWMVLAGVFEAVVLVLQLTAMQFTVAALVISIKRSGIVLAVFLGWLIFKERGITDRVIAACVMLSGVLVFFLTKPDAQGHATVGLTGALAVAVVALAGMGVALYMTHSKPVPEHRNRTSSRMWSRNRESAVAAGRTRPRFRLPAG